ncbi:uncharacterized protein LOC134464707 [Engraulis encrasicolus]|uniref:uncharacterized protein LOC134464707 n=1 Tax=Engraulis encrasicolus TaxID=184585 RepID=UPI002FCF855B
METIRWRKKEFVVPKDLEVCFLTDSMCRGLDQWAVPAGGQVWVHPETTLARSIQHHTYHVETLKKDAVVVIHIGTNDMANGASATEIAEKMEMLIRELQNRCDYKLMFAVSSILPHLADNARTRDRVKSVNKLLEVRCDAMSNVCFVRTNKAFLKKREVVAEMYMPDGLHLTEHGKMTMFCCFRQFLWHFCRFSLRVPDEYK